MPGRAAAPPSALFDAAADGAPRRAAAWFDRSAFLDEKFNPDAYVSSMRAKVPLEPLREELSAHLATLQAELVDLINRDYADFVSLSTRLAGVDGAAAAVSAPLVALRIRLTTAHGRLTSALAALESGLNHRAAAAAARTRLELTRDAVAGSAKAETLLAELGGDGPSSTVEDEPSHAGAAARAQLLERVAGELSRLAYHLTRGADLPPVAALVPRATSARASLIAHLGRALRGALGARATEATGRCLAAFAAVGCPEGAEAAARDALVAPMVARAIAAAGGGMVAGTPPPPLAPILRAIAAGVTTDCAFLLELAAPRPTGGATPAAAAPASPAAAFDFLGNAILAEADAALASAGLIPPPACPGTPGASPAVFLADHATAMGLLSGLEAKCRTRAELAAFRSSAATVRYTSRWDGRAYAAARAAEILRSLESSLAGPAIPAPPSPIPPGAGSLPGTQPYLAQTAAAWTALTGAWAPGIFLPAAAGIFFGAAVAGCARYVAWLDDGASAQRAAWGGGSDATGATGGEGPTAVAAGAGGKGGWAVGAPPETLGGAWRDALWLASALSPPAASGTQATTQAMTESVTTESVTAVAAAPPDYGALVARKLGGLTPAARAAASSALSESAASLADAGGRLAGCVGDALASACCEVLKQLRGITAVYRMTNKPAPSRCSHFVPGVLAPLRTFLDADATSTSPLPPGARQGLVSAVAESVTVRYAELGRELAATVRRTESSLKRLQARKEGGVGAAAGASDADKICAQLFLDCQEHGRQLARLGLTPASMESYVSLWAATAPPDQAAVLVI